ncbi:uncharacterized protein LOC111433690 isoform X3 [Cucurbita moschata]|uniref:Uncharacterized protein LOC111433690 isoform X3 n=1 Tax=Cucurbita moschata TaxID=3662 RepID=A0A6J1ELL4_CUCMO|nr:uncharacterized protein LOC111433690 isoform X3 [Cucurbita moschata]
MELISILRTGIISPSKLRMKLMAPHHKKKDGSSSNSSRTSPSKLEDTEFVRNSLLLATENGGFEEEDAETCHAVTSSCFEVLSENVLNQAVSDSKQSDRSPSLPKEFLSESDRNRMQECLKGDSCNSSTINPSKSLEDENLDYDSNASSSSFEFHKGERSAQSSISRSHLRPMPSKWNDAEKWIMIRQNNGQAANYSKKNVAQNHGYRMMAANMVRVAPESANSRLRSSIGNVVDANHVDFCQSEKFSFVPAGAYSFADDELIDPCSQINDLKEVDHKPSSKASKEDSTGFPAIRAVSMRDMGTEMTPVPSQEPSRTATPVGASPLRTPISSTPSTPRRDAPAPTPTEQSAFQLQQFTENGHKELSKDEMKLKTRREILALGMQLGKSNIAAWASKDEQEKNRQNVEIADKEALKRAEFEKRAAVWEEVEKSKHMARYRREEIQIEAWENQQKTKLEAEMRRVEAQVEQMRAEAEVSMIKKIAMTKQKSEEKRAAAECRKRREAERASAQAEYIRQTGRMPSSPYICCGWL